MTAVKTETQSTRLYDYNKIFGQPKENNLKRFELPKLTTYNQKETMMCVGYALATAGEILFEKQMSPGWTYGKFRSHKLQGMFLEETLKYACEIGLVPLSDFGIFKEVPEIIDIVNAHPELLEIAKKYKLSGYCNLNYADKAKRNINVKDAIGRYKDKVAVIATSIKHFGANHCVAIVGWNDDTDSWIYQNSYGINNEDEGRGEIPRDKINSIYAVFLEPIKLPFVDVPDTPNNYQFKAIRNLFLADIMNGISETEFNPNGYITRGDMAVVVNRALAKVDNAMANNSRLQYEAEE